MLDGSPLYQRRMQALRRDSLSGLQWTPRPRNCVVSQEKTTSKDLNIASDAVDHEVAQRPGGAMSFSSVTADLCLQDSPDKADVSYQKEEVTENESSQQGTDKGDFSDRGEKIHLRRHSKISAVTTTADGSSHQGSDDESDLGNSASTEGSLHPGTQKSKLIDDMQNAAFRRSLHPQGATEEESSLQHTPNPTWFGDKQTRQQGTGRSALAAHEKDPLAREYIPRHFPAASGHRGDLRAEMQQLRNYAAKLYSTMEDTSVEFVKELNKAVCFGAARARDRKEILAFCSFRQELLQLKDYAEELAILVEDGQLISDLAGLLDAVKEIQLSSFGKNTADGGSQAALALSDHDPHDPLIKIARSLDLRDLASEMQRLHNIATQVNSRVEEKALQLAEALNEAVNQSTRAVGRDEVLLKFATNAEAELKQLKEYADTLSVFLASDEVVSNLLKMSDLLQSVKVHVLLRIKEQQRVH